MDAEVSRVSDAWATTQTFGDNKAPKGFVEAEASWTPDASNRGLTSLVGLGRSWTPSVSQGFADAKVSGVRDACRMLADPQDPEGFVDAEALWAPDASICAYPSTVGPGRPWTPKEFQGLADAEASRASDGRGLQACHKDSWVPSPCGRQSLWTGPRKLIEASRASHGRGLETC